MKKILLIILTISIILGACTIESNQSGDTGDNELNYLISQSGDLVLPLTRYSTLNPLINDNQLYFYFSKLIFEGLFEFDENLEPEPRLAKDYRIDSEGNVSIELRDDVLWHDGEKFTSRDVKFTIDALKAGANTIYSGLFNSSVSVNSNIMSVNIVDEYNLVISFNQLSPNLLGLLTFPIVPEHAFDSLSMALDEEYSPIGTGPFKYVSSNSSKNIDLVANENYRFNKPKIERVTGNVLDDEDLFLTSFEAGQIDITITSQADWNRYRSNRSVNIIEFVSSNYEFLGFNFNNSIFSDHKGQAIRKAIVYGIDRQNIIQNIYSGHGSQTDLPLHPNSYILADDMITYGYNPETSKKLLNEAGFEDIDGDGLLEDVNGKKLVFRYLTNPSNPSRRRTAELIKQDLNEVGIGIEFDFDIRTNEEYSREIKQAEWDHLNNKIDRADFDIVQLGLNMSVVSDLGHLFHSKGSGNFINYRDEKMDSLISNYESQGLDSKINEELQKHVVNELPYVSLFFKNKAMLINSKIVGELKPTYYNPYGGLENCFIVVQGH